MTVAFIIIVIGIWLLYSSWRFYKNVNWAEPKPSTERRIGKGAGDSAVKLTVPSKS